MSHVYVVRRADGLVKVGHSTNVRKRLASLQTMHAEPLDLLGCIPNGGRETERKIHKQLRPAHVRGEWFWMSDEDAESARLSLAQRIPAPAAVFDSYLHASMHYHAKARMAESLAAHLYRAAVEAGEVQAALEPARTT